MFDFYSTIEFLLIRRRDRRPNGNRQDSPIRILNDDVLLIIFDLYRPDLNEYDDKTMSVLYWHHQRWWYKLAHVCRQWRNVILESPGRLGLHLYCTKDVPVADILAHSPPLLPLTINYHVMDRMVMTPDDESGLLLALSKRDRVRHVLFWMLPNVDKFVTVMDDQFPILERMYIDSSRTEWEVVLPVTFQAPNLRHLKLWTAWIPIGSPLLTTSTGLVTLELLNIPPSANFPPSCMLRTWISLMAQLERLSITFQSPIHVQSQSPQTPDTTTLPKLQSFLFKGTSAYLEGLVALISAPSLNKLHVYLYSQFSFFTVPRLLQLMQTSKSLTFNTVQVTFSFLSVSLRAVPGKWDTRSPLILQIECDHLNEQVASAVQIFGTLSPILSVIEKVTFSYEQHFPSSEHDDIDRRLWRGLLRPFTNAKTVTLHVQGDLVRNIFRSLLSDDGEPPLELLPNLEQVEYSGGSEAQDAFTRFRNERQAAGHPVTMYFVDPWTRMFN